MTEVAHAAPRVAQIELVARRCRAAAHFKGDAPQAALAVLREQRPPDTVETPGCNLDLARCGKCGGGTRSKSYLNRNRRSANEDGRWQRDLHTSNSRSTDAEKVTQGGLAKTIEMFVHPKEGRFRVELDASLFVDFADHGVCQRFVLLDSARRHLRSRFGMVTMIDEEETIFSLDVNDDSVPHGLGAEILIAQVTAQYPEYACPFCAIAVGEETAYNAQSDVIHRDALTTAFVCPKWWAAAPAHALVVPNKHYENVYSIPDAELAAVYATAKKVAIAIRSAYACEGTSMRQHNEQGGGQDVWHFHVHVFPRQADDRLYERNTETRIASPGERAQYAELLRRGLQVRSEPSATPALPN